MPELTPQLPVKIADLLQPLLPRKGEVGDLLTQLKLGQIVPARVLHSGGSGLVRLQIGAQQIIAQTRANLQAGALLQLRVTSTGQLPQLRIENPGRPLEDRSLILRSVLGTQQAPAKVQQALTQLLTTATQTGDRQTANIARAVLTLLGDRALVAQGLDSGQLRRALHDSGILLEAHVARGEVPTADLKLNLLRLLAQAMRAGQTPPGDAARAANGEGTTDARAAMASNSSLLGRLLSLIEASVARVQLHQAAAMPGDDNGRQFWQFELPIRLADRIHYPNVRIEHEPAEERNRYQATWAVSIAFEFDQLGPVQSRIVLQANRISATFFSAQADTERLFRDHLDDLHQTLRSAGLDVASLISVLGSPAEDMHAIRVQSTLLDERI